MIEIIEAGVGRRHGDNGRKLYQVISHGNRGFKPYCDVVRTVLTDNPQKVIARWEREGAVGK